MSTPTEPPPPEPSTEPGEPTPVLVIAVCHTSGCPRCDVPLWLWCWPNPPEFPPVFAVLCASCDTAITDVTPYSPPAT